jgi:hypothetical protein
MGPIAGKALLNRRKQLHFESFRSWLPILEDGHGKCTAVSIGIRPS